MKLTMTSQLTFTNDFIGIWRYTELYYSSHSENSFYNDISEALSDIRLNGGVLILQVGGHIGMLTI